MKKLENILVLLMLAVMFVYGYHLLDGAIQKGQRWHELNHPAPSSGMDKDYAFMEGK